MSKLGDIFDKKLEEKQFDVKKQHWDELSDMLDKHDGIAKTGGNGIKNIFLKGKFLFIGACIVVGTVVWSITQNTEPSDKADNEITRTQNITKGSVETIKPQEWNKEITASIKRGDDQNIKGIQSKNSSFNTSIMEDDLESKIVSKDDPENKEKNFIHSGTSMGKITPASKFNTRHSPEHAGIAKQNGSSKILNGTKEDLNSKTVEGELLASTSDFPVVDSENDDTQGQGSRLDATEASIQEESEILAEEPISKKLPQDANVSDNSVGERTFLSNEEMLAREINSSDGAEVDAEEPDNDPLNALIASEESESMDVDPGYMDYLGIADLSVDLEETPPNFLKEDKVGLRIKPTIELNPYLGVSQVTKVLKTNNSEFQNYVDRRNAEEQLLYAGTYGVEGSISLGNWSFTSGIGALHLGEVTNYSSEFLQWVPEEKVEWIVDEQSYWGVDSITFSIWEDDNLWVDYDTVFTFWSDITQSYVTDTVILQEYNVSNLSQRHFSYVDTVLVSEFDSVKLVTVDSVQRMVTDPSQSPAKNTTRISYYEVPLLLGYEYPINRFRVGVKTGLGIGILSMQEVNYLKSDLSGIETLDISQTKRVIYNYMLRASIKYDVSEKFALKAEPNFRMNLTSVFKSQDYSQKYRGTGVMVGIIYKL